MTTTATTRLGLSKSLLRRNPLLSFLSRESPSSIKLSSTNHSITLTPYVPTTTTTQSSTNTNENRLERNPFLPSKKPNSKQWNAPTYSIRRQKLIFKSTRLQQLNPHELLSSLLSTTSTSPSSSSFTEVGQTGKALMRSSKYIPSTGVLDQLQLVKKGPYKGRKGNAFKAKAWQRQKETRLQQLNTLLQGADEKEITWRNGLKADKKKGKNALPF